MSYPFRFFCLALFGWSFSAQAATFTSTVAGGIWSTPTTWEEGSVPTALDDVLIVGPVDIYVTDPNNPVSVNNLQINPGGALRSRNFSFVRTYYIEVNGNFLNNGDVEDQGAGRLDLTVKGDIQTTGNFDPYTIRAEGDIDNQGVWSANELYVLGAGNKSFIGTELMASDVFLEVDVTPQEDWEFTGGITQNNNSTVTLSSGRTLKIHQDIKDIFRTTGAGVVELAGDNFQTIRAEIQAEKVLVTGDDVQIYNSTELDPIRITGDLEIAAGGILTAQSSSVLRYRYLDIGGNLTNNGTIQDNIAGRVDARVAGDFQQLGTVTGGDISILKDFLNTGSTYTPNDTFVRWVDDPAAVEYELEFASLYNSWDPAIVLTDNFYNIDSKVSQDWYWRYRAKFADDSYSDFSSVRFINTPTGHEVDVPVITLVTDSTDWPNGGDPTITVTIVSTQELNRAEIFYTCNTGTCQTSLIPTINPDEFNITIDRTTFPDGDFSYWIEAENDHAVMGVLGSEVALETLSESAVSGGGSKPPEKISQIRALSCDGKLYLNFYKPYKAQQVKVYVAEKTEEVSKKKNLLALQNYQDRGNGFVAYEVTEFDNQFKYLGGISVGSNNKLSDLSEVAEIETVSNCKNYIDVQLETEDLDQNRMKFRWIYDYLVLEDLTKSLYPQKGSSLVVKFQDGEAVNKASFNIPSKYQWTSGKGEFIEILDKNVIETLARKSDLPESKEPISLVQSPEGFLAIKNPLHQYFAQDLLVSENGQILGTVPAQVSFLNDVWQKIKGFFTNQTLERVFVIGNNQGKDIINVSIALLNNEPEKVIDYTFDHKITKTPSGDCQYLDYDPSQWCAFVVEITNTSEVAWDVNIADWGWVFERSVDLTKWDIKGFDLGLESQEAKSYTFVYKGDKEGFKKEADMTVMISRNGQKLEGIINLEVQKRDFKTSIKGVKIYEAKSQASKVLVTIPEVNSELVVLGRAEDGTKYIDKYKTQRWYKVRFNDVEGWVVATVVRPEWIQRDLLKSTENYSDSRFNKGIDYKVNKIVLHSTGDNKDSRGVKNYFENASTSIHFIIDRKGNILQILPINKTAYHASDLIINLESIGIEMVNWGPLLNKDDKYYSQTGQHILDIENVEISHKEAWDVWSLENNHVTEVNVGGKSNMWQPYTDIQYEKLSLLLSYLRESLGVPLNFPDYPASDLDSKYNDYAFYFSPRKKYSSTPENWEKFYQYLLSFSGIISHKNTVNKYDPGPHFDFRKINID